MEVILKLANYYIDVLYDIMQYMQLYLPLLSRIMRRELFPSKSMGPLEVIVRVYVSSSSMILSGNKDIEMQTALEFLRALSVIWLDMTEGKSCEPAN